MSVIVDGYSHAQSISILISAGFSAQTYYATTSFNGLAFAITNPSHSNSQRLSVAGVFANIPHGASLGYQAILAGSAAVKLSYLHVRQAYGAQMTIECRVLGSLSQNRWYETAIGQTIVVNSVAVDVEGNTIATESLFFAEVTDLLWTGSQIKLYLIGSQEIRAPRTIVVENILYLQFKSDGSRVIRLPAVWGVQAGDTITHPSIEDLTIATFSLTIQNGYKVIDATESV